MRWAILLTWKATLGPLATGPPGVGQLNSARRPAGHQEGDHLTMPESAADVPMIRLVLRLTLALARWAVAKRQSPAAGTASI